MILKTQLDWLHEQLQEAKRNNRPYNEVLLQELDVLEKDPVITGRINQLHVEKRLPPVTGPPPFRCASCGKPLP